MLLQVGSVLCCKHLFAPINIALMVPDTSSQPGMLLRMNSALRVLCMLSQQPHKQPLQPYYSFDEAAAALHTKAELTSLIEADRLDSDSKQGADKTACA